MKSPLYLRLSLLLPLLISLSVRADGSQSIPPSDVKPWRAESKEGTVEKANSPSLTSSLPEETNKIATFAARTAPAKSSADHIIWVYDADVTIFNDVDGDGYYRSLRVSFDVDTILSHANIYAVVYLGDALGYREIHTTSVFDIYSDASDDEFVFSTDLLQGFSSWDYDLLIEIYDAQNHQLQDVYGHTNDADLSFLPLESNEFEHRYSSSITSTVEHGGSVGIGFILGLLSLLTWRRNSLMRKAV